MSRHHFVGAVAAGWLVALGSLGSLAGEAHAAPPPPPSPAPIVLGAAGAFAVLANTTVTSAGVSTLTGDLGVSPGVAATGFPPGADGVVNGTIDIDNSAAAAGQADLAKAYADAVSRGPAVPITTDLGGMVLAPGVYAAGASLPLTGTLTLDANGDPAAVFILQAGSTLITAANSHVILTGGAQSCNVFWQVGSSATLGASSSLDGTILASTSITMGDSVTIDGRALAVGAAVTTINDTVTAQSCAGSLTNTAPAIAPFTAKLTGLNQTVSTALGPWSVTDATGSNAGYSVTVSATAPTVNGSTAGTGTGGSLTLTPTTATAAIDNPPSTGPVPMPAQTLGTTAATIENAVPGTGQGEWDFAADSGSTNSLSVLIPGNALAGSYSSTLTFTTAPPAA
jgi:hypothetical protein